MASTALLLIDFINPFDFEHAEQLLAHARPAARRAAALAGRCRATRVPVIFVNDNFGRWRSSFEETCRACREGPGSDIVELLRARDDDYFVLKPHRSGFYATPLELLLRKLSVSHVLVGGLTTDMCVLSTVHDAVIREIAVTVVMDACATFGQGRHRQALELLQVACGAELVWEKDVAPSGAPP